MIEGFVPYVVYIPKKSVMFKIMRGCIECDLEKDLWFINKK